ncbi:MAG: hypothetical protein ACE5JV_00575 [Nitrososphaerales archaeon]
MPDLNEQVEGRRTQKRYKIHIYSFKKFAFTTMADTLGEIAARAKGRQGVRVDVL